VLLNAHIGEIDTFAKLRDGQALTALDLSEDKKLLALGQFSKELTLHRLLIFSKIDPFLSGRSEDGSWSHIKVIGQERQVFLPFSLKKVARKLSSEVIYPK
jgi:hypothetical protein